VSAYFFATDDDFRELAPWLFDENDLVITEAHAYDREIRPLKTVDELAEAMTLDPAARPTVTRMLALYSPAFKGNYIVERLEYTHPKVQHDFASEVRGWGVIRIHLPTWRNDRLGNCMVQVNSEKRAHYWGANNYPELGPPGDWDWGEVRRVTRRITYWLRKRAVDKLDGRPILPGANAARENGVELG
jgi:hypothetical protein